VKADAETGGNYYLAGLVLRSGVYSIPARRINVKQAIVSAGIKEETNNAYFTVIRRSNDDEESFAMENARFQDVLSGKEGELYIHDKRYHQRHQESRSAARQRRASLVGR